MAFDSSQPFTVEAAPPSAAPAFDPGKPFAVEPATPATSAPEEKHTTLAGIEGSLARGAAPYVAGAAVGAGVGSVVPGVGTALGAAAGATAVGLTDMTVGVARALGITHLPTISEGVNNVMDWFGVRRPTTGLERTAETTAAGVGGAVSGVRAAGELAETLTNPIAKGVAAKLAERPVAQAVSGGISGASTQAAAESGAGPGGQQLAGFLGSVAPFVKPGMGGLVRIDPKAAAKAAIDKGYVLPPVEAAEGGVSPYSAPSVLSAWSGKIKMGQGAATKNQPVTNRLASEDLGLPKDTMLTPSAFDAVRAREGRVYEDVVKAVPEVDLARDPEFAADVRAIGAQSAETEKLFPSTKEPPGVTALRAELMANARGSTKAVMNYIADLRFKATQNFKAQGDAMAHRMGYAQRDAAHVLEDVMERSVQNAPAYYAEKLADATARKGAADAAVEYATRSQIPKLIDGATREAQAAAEDIENWSARVADAQDANAGNQTLVDRFRSARQMMAKSYDYESVTNVSTGDVSATGLGRLLQKGRPFTGNQKIIADAANHFPRSFQNPAAFGGVEPLSVLDTLAAGAAVAHGNLGLAGAVLGRPLARSTALSHKFQRAMVSPFSPPALPLSVLQALGGQPNAAQDLGVPQ